MSGLDIKRIEEIRALHKMEVHPADPVNWDSGDAGFLLDTVDELMRQANNVVDSFYGLIVCTSHHTTVEDLEKYLEGEDHGTR